MKKFPLIIGNWKMYKTNTEAKAYVSSLLSLLEEVKTPAGLAVPYTAISLCADLAKDHSLLIGAQNMHSAEEGAFTGEIAADMLVDAGAEFVIIGHSERRKLFGESNADVAKKAQKALEKGLQVIVCVGEEEKHRKKGREAFLEAQLKESLQGVKKDFLASLCIAYEPVWAIGTGKSAKPDEVDQIHQFLRSILETMFTKTHAKKVAILYGGSVKKENIVSYMKKTNVQGALIGGASLKAHDFADMVQLH